MNTYRSKAVLREIIGDIDEQMRSARRYQLMRVLDCISRTEVESFINLQYDKTDIVQNYLPNKLILYLLHRFQCTSKADQEELLKVKKAVDLYEYTEFKELIKLGGEDNIENEGDMLDIFLNESAKEMEVLERHREVKDCLVGELQGFLGLVKQWSPTYQLNHKSIMAFIKNLLEWYTVQIRSIEQKERAEGASEKERAEGASIQSIQGEAVQISHMDKCNYLHSLALVLTSLEPYIRSIDDTRFLDYLSSQKANNFSLYLRFLHLHLREQLEFKAEETQRDIDKSYYNSILHQLTDQVVAHAPSLTTYPLFTLDNPSCLEKVYEFVLACLTVD